MGIDVFISKEGRFIHYTPQGNGSVIYCLFEDNQRNVCQSAFRKRFEKSAFRLSLSRSTRCGTAAYRIIKRYHRPYYAVLPWFAFGLPSKTGCDTHPTWARDKHEGRGIPTSLTPVSGHLTSPLRPRPRVDPSGLGHTATFTRRLRDPPVSKRRQIYRGILGM